MEVTINLDLWYVAIVQIFCLSALGYFVFKSLFFIYIDLKEEYTDCNGKKCSKGFNAFALMYLFLSILFIFIYIMSIDEIYLLLNEGVNDIQKSKSDSYIPIDKTSNEFDVAIRIALSSFFLLTLSMFSFNFSKSLSTLSALDTNRLGLSRFDDILNSKKKIIIERFLRVSLAFIFITIEQNLYAISYIDEMGQRIDIKTFQSYFESISVSIFFLYALLLIWYFGIVHSGIKNNVAFDAFRKHTASQFIAGLGISFSFGFIAIFDIFNYNIFSLFILLTLLGIVFCSIRFFFWPLFVIEYKFYKNVYPKLKLL